MRKKRFTCPQAAGTIHVTYGDNDGYPIFDFVLSKAGYDFETPAVRVTGLSRLECVVVAITMPLAPSPGDDSHFDRTASVKTASGEATATRQGRGNNQLLIVRLSGPFFAGCTPEFQIRGEWEAAHFLATLKRHVPAVE